MADDTPTPDELANDLAGDLADGFLNGDIDGTRWTRLDPEKRLNVIERLAGREAYNEGLAIGHTTRLLPAPPG